MKIEKHQFGSLAAALSAFGVGNQVAHNPQAYARAERIGANVKRNKRKKTAKEERIAILDMETDPFDNITQDIIFPFLAVLYAPEFDPVVIWEEDHEAFVYKLIKAIKSLPGKYTIYAHNGGKFDYMFLIKEMRGKVSFKGRGIMEASIGNHILRDSYHIIPEKLASLQKMEFDYKNLYKKVRNKFRKTIIEYCISDCENLYFYVKRFIENNGFKISIGAASMAKLRENYEIDRVTEKTDAYLRRYYFGGRVECLTGAIHYNGHKKLYDINSAYPDAMARLDHPVGSEYIIHAGPITDNTCFITLRCKNRGALMARGEDGSVGTTKKEGEFCTSIYEYRMALKLKLISDVEIIECVDNIKWTNFEEFIFPLYAHRSSEKARLDTLTPGSVEWNECNVNVVFDKLYMNNAYGKTAQDPRRFREHYISDPGEFPPRELVKSGEEGFETEFMSKDYWVWSRPSPTWRFLNVGTGASITGAVRAKLMEAIHNAVNPVYCDTDSLICDDLPNTELDHLKLGAWDIEKEIKELIVCGKKLYGYKTVEPDKKGKDTYIKSKGAAGLTWDDMLKLLAGEHVTTINNGVTLTRRGDQKYLTREIRSTAMSKA